MNRDGESLTQSAQRRLGLLALFIAPTSLVTGLCYFFGLVYIRSRLDYFGIDPSTLGLTTADYVVAVVKTFFFATLRVLAVLAVVVLLAVAVRKWAATRRRIGLLRATAWGVLLLGALSIGNGVYWLAFEVLPIAWLVESAGATYTAWSIVLGIALLVAGYWMLAISGRSGGNGKRLPPNAERALIALAVTGIVVALFWITNMYAADLGKRDADFDAQELWANEKSVQLDTTEVLSPPSRLVKTSLLPSAGGSVAPTYRYECLRVIEVHNGHYVLLPAKWTRESGWAVAVTPDSTHRINGLVNVGLADTTGNGANVHPFWQCPEVVRYFQESDLDQMLVGSDVVGTILGEKAVTAGQSEAAASAPIGENNAPSTNDCAVQDNPAESTPVLPPYPGDGLASRRLEITSDGTSGPLWVRQRVTSFPNPATAQGFFASTQQRWGYCAGKVVMVDRKGSVEPRTLSLPGIQQDILAAADSAVGSGVDDCAQAVGAKSNVVIQVDVCGAEQPLLATGVVAAMRQQIPV